MTFDFGNLFKKQKNLGNFFPMKGLQKCQQQMRGLLPKIFIYNVRTFTDIFMKSMHPETLLCQKNATYMPAFILVSSEVGIFV